MTAILFVHGFPLDASMWDEQVEAFRDDATCLAPSLPGFGGAPMAGDVLTVEKMAETLEAELDRAEVERVVACGLSMGGYSVFELWRRSPERIVAMALADTRAVPDSDQARKRRLAVAEAARAQGSEAIAGMIPTLMAPNADPAVAEHVRGIGARQPGEAIAAASLGMAERPDSTPTLATIDVPTTVIVGAEDQLIPPEVAGEMAQEIRDAELAEIDGAGHLSSMENAKAFNEALHRLLVRAR